MRALRNVERILAAEGMSLRHVVKVMVWLKREDHFATFNRAYARVLKNHRPARSTVRADLMLPGALVEIEAVAARAGRSR